MQFRISRRRLLASSVFLLPGMRLPGQQQDPKYTADVKVVNVFVAVHTKQGQIVQHLTKDDFTLEEDSRPQTIRYFSAQTDLPLTLGLLADTSGSMRRVLEEERGASYRFLEQVLRPDKDQAFVIHFDREVELLQDLTSSKKALESAVGSLEATEPRQLNRRGGYPQGGGTPSGGGSPQGGNGGHGRMGGTALYDAVLLASDELMKKQQGRKALMLLSDGMDNASKVSLSQAVESAQRAETLVYSIRIHDEQQGAHPGGGYPGGHHGGMGGMGRGGGMGAGYPPSRLPAPNSADGKKTLERISRETGGGYFEASGKQPLSKIYSLIEEELRNQYNLGYTSDKAGSPGEYRRIRVAAKEKSLIVQARDGYYTS